MYLDESRPITAMHECAIDIIAGIDGDLTLDIHEPNSSGSSRVTSFRSWDELQAFFRSLGLGNDKLTELQQIARGLEQGSSYHQTMFLPISPDGEVH